VSPAEPPGARGEPAIGGDLPDLYLFERTAELGLHAWVEDPARALMDRIDDEAVATALASLPEEDQLVVTLYFLRDLSYREIAAVVGLPVGTLRSRLHRARRRLQRRLWDLAVERGIPTALVEERRP
jgi:RNA polymerase sigma-70 factor (ECF subfamily)